MQIGISIIQKKHFLSDFYICPCLWWQSQVTLLFSYCSYDKLIKIPPPTHTHTHTHIYIYIQGKDNPPGIRLMSHFIYWSIFYISNPLCFPVLSLKCYQCSSADEDSCKSTQTIQTCSNRNQRMKCITISYTLVNDYVNKSAVTKHVLQKRCLKRHIGCQLYCRSLQIIGARNCKVCFTL